MNRVKTDFGRSAVSVMIALILALICFGAVGTQFCAAEGADTSSSDTADKIFSDVEDTLGDSKDWSDLSDISLTGDALSEQVRIVSGFVDRINALAERDAEIELLMSELKSYKEALISKLTLEETRASVLALLAEKKTDIYNAGIYAPWDKNKIESIYEDAVAKINTAADASSAYIIKDAAVADMNAVEPLYTVWLIANAVLVLIIIIEFVILAVRTNKNKKARKLNSTAALFAVEAGGFLMGALVFAVLLVIAIVLLICIIAGGRSNKVNKDSAVKEPSEKPAAEEAAEEPAAEEVAEEPAAEEVAEEPAAEEVAEEPAAEEVAEEPEAEEVAEEPAAEEAAEEPAAEEVTEEPAAEEVTEEPAAEEVAEEPAAEEVAEEPEAEEVTEEPAAEEVTEEPAAEEAAEEPAAEEVTEEPAAEEATTEENEVKVVPAAAASSDSEESDEEDEDDSHVYTRDGKKILIQYRYSFMAKLIQSKQEVQSRYGEIADEMSACKGVRRNCSWKHERYSYGRNPMFLLFFKGRTLCIALALDPKSYADTKYRGEDLSDSKRFEKTPMMLKLTSDRKVKYAKELIALIVENYGIKKGEVVHTDFSLPYQPTEDLIEKGLVKIFSGAAPTDNAQFVKANIADLIRDKITLHEAQLSISDIAAASLVETVEKLNEEQQSVTQGKRGIINIDTISDNFQNGDVVTLDALKAKDLVPKNVIRLKVLARGILDKAITVEAHEFSIDAVKMIALTGGKVVRIL